MVITKQTAADKIAAYLHHDITVEQLVDWAENALMDGEFAEQDAAILAAVVGRLGVADVRDGGITGVTELFHAADTALYLAKAAGRNRVVRYSQSTLAEATAAV